MAADRATPHQVSLPALLAVLVSVSISTLDISLTNTALPAIARDIGAASATSIWVVNVYYLVVVASLLPLAALGEIFGHRRVFIAGILVFMVGSLASGLAWSLPTLVAARAVLGLGAAAISAVTPALIRFIYPPQHLGRGLGVYALVVGVAFTAGPTIAAAVLAVANWPWLYLVNLPVGLVATGLTLRSLPATERNARPFDGLSATLCAALFALILTGLSGLAHQVAWIWILAAWIGAAFCGYALLQREAGRPAPILAVDLFRRPLFSLSSATSVCAFAVQGLAFVVLPFWLHTGLGFSQSETGLLITPWPATLAVMALIAAPLADRHSPGLLGGGGLLILCGGMASLALLPSHPTPLDIAWRMSLCGVGFGFFQAPNMKAIMASAPRERSGGASGIVATSRLLGQAIGAALVALCLSASPAGGALMAVWVGCCIAILGSLMSLSRLLPAVRGRV
ncbi:MFS transporter [Pseudoroseomonas wenyumeiae]|uniref:MFS transporter n=1 Tax=Teichococcus wenyumeiae TaxID=2478470 RepID=A0A3A9JPV4_9PROT|nr:MFS transporter [Pseudoroseomonas wenyumeiae]RMI26168.1 MFS transporter [Pseudoroseomonas wenyumeiae]